MRGRRAACLVLALALLSGCGWMDGSYVSVTPHQVGAGQTAEDNTMTVGSYLELRSALVRMVDEGTTEGRFLLEDYPRETAVADVDRAVEYVTETYPIGAYAVESVHYDFGTNAVSVDIAYSHTRQQVESIRSVRGVEGARKAITEAMDECADKLVLQISGYRDMDYQQIARDYAQLYPDRVMELPNVTHSICPDRGDVRVVELLFFYRTDRETLKAMREQVQPVFSSAALYVSGQADQRTKFSQLHSFLMERYDYQLLKTTTPAYSLLCEGVGDDGAFAQIYAAMCSRIGLEALSIRGTLEGEKHSWNLIRIDGVWYHLDLLASAQFRPMTDGEMEGYDWTREDYPAAG